MIDCILEGRNINSDKKQHNISRKLWYWKFSFWHRYISSGWQVSLAGCITAHFPFSNNNITIALFSVLSKCFPFCITVHCRARYLIVRGDSQDRIDYILTATLGIQKLATRLSPLTRINLGNFKNIFKNVGISSFLYMIF